MNKSHNIFLIGPMGAGKSTIGRLLSEDLNLPFQDSDRVIEQRAGADIPWIFDLEGEEGFRQREEQTISELCKYKGVVLATGGGAVMREANRKCLRDCGLVVYLKTSIEQQLARTEKDKNRPLLQTPNPKQVLTELMNRRGPVYEECADLVIETDGLSPKAVVKNILEFINRQESAS